MHYVYYKDVNMLNSSVNMHTVKIKYHHSVNANSLHVKKIAANFN